MEDDWQNVLVSRNVRNGHLLSTANRADCHFVVGDVIFPAHKILLASISPILGNMVYGTTSKSGEELIEVKDIEAPVFKDMLMFIYTDNVAIKSVGKAIHLYKAAKKYKIGELKIKCVDFLKNQISNNSVCEILEFSIRFKNNDLRNKCMTHIKNYTANVIKSDAFNLIDPSTLDLILSEDKLAVSSEVKLFDAIHSYALYWYPSYKLILHNIEKQIASGELDFNKKISEIQCAALSDEKKGFLNIEQQTAGFLYLMKLVKSKIRFKTMNPFEFLKGPAQSGMLRSSDALAIFNYLVRPKEMPTKYPIGFCHWTTNRFKLDPKQIKHNCNDCFHHLRCYNCDRYKYRCDDFVSP